MSKAITPPRYTVIIQWSDEDHAYVVSLPEWGWSAKTHGSTYEEAAKNAREVLEMLMDDENGKPVNLPAEKHFCYPGADVVNLPDVGASEMRRKISVKKTRQSA
jgi:predicted RNase H-like HicB family nuclease